MPSNFLFFPVDMLAEHRAHAELSERVARAAMLAKPSREVPGAGAAASTPNSYGSIAVSCVRVYKLHHPQARAKKKEKERERERERERVSAVLYCLRIAAIGAASTASLHVCWVDMRTAYSSSLTPCFGTSSLYANTYVCKIYIISPVSPCRARK